MFDYFVAHVLCPGCQNETGELVEVDVKTHLRDDADGTSMRVGYTFEPSDLEPENFLESGYVLVSPSQPRSIRLAEGWDCPACGIPCWIVVEIVDQRIERIEAIAASRAALESINYISKRDAEDLAAQLAEQRGTPFAEQHENVIERLRQELP